MTVDPLLYLVAGAFGAAILTVGAGFFGAWIQSRREHVRWVREQRLDVYRGFLRVSELTWPMQSTDREVWRAHQDNMSAALGEVILVGPNRVLTAATLHLDAVLDLGSLQRKVNGVEGRPPKPELRADYERAAAHSNTTRENLVIGAREALKIKG